VLYLCTVEERIQLLKNEGVDIVVALSFNRELAKLSAREFVTLLVKHLKMRGLIIGPDFSLGKNREGNAETLRALGQEMGFQRHRRGAEINQRRSCQQHDNPAGAGKRRYGKK